MADPLSPSGMRGCEALGVFSSLSPGSRSSVVTSAVQMAVRAGVTVPLSLSLSLLPPPSHTQMSQREEGRKGGGREEGREGQRDGGQFNPVSVLGSGTDVIRKISCKIFRLHEPRCRFHIVCWSNSTSDSCLLACQLAAKYGTELCISRRHRVMRLCLI